MVWFRLQFGFRKEKEVFVVFELFIDRIPKILSGDKYEWHTNERRFSEYNQFAKFEFEFF